MREAARTARRFPLALAAALVAVGAGLDLVGPGPDEPAARLLAAALPGVPLLAALTLWAEAACWRRANRLAARLGGLGLLVGLYVALPHWSDPVALRRWLQLVVAVHMLVAVGPFLGDRGENAFWQFNRILFLRFLLGALYAAVLFGGLALALGALDRLLGVPVPDRSYLWLWIVLAVGFHPWFVLAGVPRDLPALSRLEEYPAGLKAFSQYVLLPLVTVYMAILIVYLARVAVTRDWPSGWIAYLVSGVAVAGILSLLLVRPIRERRENRWVVLYGRGFHVALLPAVAMLLAAVGKRIAQYGVTEDRYFLVVLAAWLAGVALLYGLRPRSGLRPIPASLGLLAVVTAFGPWSAYAVSLRSQRVRLADLLRTHGMLADGRVRKAAAGGAVPAADRLQIGAALSYLLEVHGPGSVAAWWPGDTLPADTSGSVAASDRTGAARRARFLVERLGLEYVPGGSPGAVVAYFGAEAEPWGMPLRITGYDYAVPVMLSGGTTSAPVTLDRPGYRLRFGARPPRLTLELDGSDLLSVPLGSVMERVRRARVGGHPASAQPPDSMRLRAEGPAGRLLVEVDRIGWTEPPGGAVRLTTLHLRLFMARPDSGARPPAPARSPAARAGSAPPP